MLSIDRTYRHPFCSTALLATGRDTVEVQAIDSDDREWVEGSAELQDQDGGLRFWVPTSASPAEDPVLGALGAVFDAAAAAGLPGLWLTWSAGLLDDERANASLYVNP